MSKITLIDKALFLKRTRLFEGLDLDLLLNIADKLSLITYEAGDPIFSQGEEAARMYFVFKGQVEIRDQVGNLVTTLQNDEFFGEESLFNEKPRAYKAVSKTNGLLLALSKTNLLTIISECPSVAVGFLHAYTSASPFRHRR